TQGSVSLYTAGMLFSGDTLFHGSVGRTDLEGGNTVQLMNTIVDRLLELPDDTIVLPGTCRRPPSAPSARAIRSSARSCDGGPARHRIVRAMLVLGPGALDEFAQLLPEPTRAEALGVGTNRHPIDREVGATAYGVGQPLRRLLGKQYAGFSVEHGVERAAA